MGYMNEIIEAEAQPALTVREVTSAQNLPKVVGRAYGQIIAYLAELGEQPLGPAFTAYFNMDMENLEVEMGFPVKKELAGKDNIKFSPIPAGKKASCFYKGPYSGMNSCYESLTKWITEKGYTPTGVVYEYYYNSPDEVLKSELLTKIEFLIK
ncbi:MAG: GyrI-like domain-containing protein [Eubacteriaceae bacterium]|nr:GyrI-like domain-containing protein [Eubacteriaceae bacterium]